MAIIEFHEHAFLGTDACGRTVPAPSEPTLPVHRPDTASGVKTVGPFSARGFLIQANTIPAADVAYEIAASNSESAGGAESGVTPVVALPFAIPVEPGHLIEVSS